MLVYLLYHVFIVKIKFSDKLHWEDWWDNTNEHDHVSSNENEFDF